MFWKFYTDSFFLLNWFILGPFCIEFAIFFLFTGQRIGSTFYFALLFINCWFLNQTFFLLEEIDFFAFKFGESCCGSIFVGYKRKAGFGGFLKI